MNKINQFFKRVFDIFASIILIILFIPIWIIIPILIKIDSKGPSYFTQRRLTKNGCVFKIIKFRTMVQNAESMGTKLISYENDERITKFGNFLRKTSIDEFPQLFNIFIGNMSFVGPRPCAEFELGDFSTLNSEFKKRFLVKAGLTGLAQVKGRNSIKWIEKVKYDNEYIELFKKCGIFLDIKILFLTFFKMFKNEHIYEIQSCNDKIESAEKENEEVIRLAHLSEGEKDEQPNQ